MNTTGVRKLAGRSVWSSLAGQFVQRYNPFPFYLLCVRMVHSGAPGESGSLELVIDPCLSPGVLTYEFSHGCSMGHCLLREIASKIVQISKGFCHYICHFYSCLSLREESFFFFSIAPKSYLADMYFHNPFFPIAAGEQEMRLHTNSSFLISLFLMPHCVNPVLCDLTVFSCLLHPDNTMQSAPDKGRQTIPFLKMHLWQV